MKRIIAIGVLIITGVALSLVSITFAIDPDIFEMDGNAIDDTTTGDDWETLYPPDTSTDDIFHIFIDETTSDPTYFIGGKSKDDEDVSEWEYKPGSSPDKDDITNAYATAYRDDDGNVYVYFGLDRYANDGDAMVGFWFFQNPIGLNPLGTNGKGSFSGTHAIGDILVLSHFTNGGVVDTIEVFRWVGSGGSDGSLDSIATGVECAGDISGLDVCAIVNTGTVASPWPYTPKSPDTGWTDSPYHFPQGSFFEGVLNLDASFFSTTFCISSFLAETRSSQELTAVLKDFALYKSSIARLRLMMKYARVQAEISLPSLMPVPGLPTPGLLPAGTLSGAKPPARLPIRLPLLQSQLK